VAFGFLGSLANIPVLSKVSRVLGTVLPDRVCSPWVIPIPIAMVGTGQGRSPLSLHILPRMHWRILLLIRICPCYSSCRRWETAAPWCDLRDRLNCRRRDGAGEPWVRLSRSELLPLSALGPSVPAGATPAVGTELLRAAPEQGSGAQTLCQTGCWNY